MIKDFICSECNHTEGVDELLKGLTEVREAGLISREAEMEEKSKVKTFKRTFIRCPECRVGIMVPNDDTKIQNDVKEVSKDEKKRQGKTEPGWFVRN